MKKIMSLGGNYFQMSAVKAAKKLGLYVIDVDYLPDNPAHAYADEYFNISITDMPKVLELAKEKEIDGIISYASDIGARTAAYVAEKLGIPTNPYESVCIMTDKGRFRKFLEENGYSVPKSETFETVEAAVGFLKNACFPIMVKPVDSSGSKGVNKIDSEEQFEKAFMESMSYSRVKRVIVEEYIESIGYQIDGDGYLIDESNFYFAAMDQHKDLKCAPYTPIGLSIPSCQDVDIKEKARDVIYSILKKLNMKMGGFNIEYLVSNDNQIYVIEIGPRNGGNLIADAIKESNGVDMISASVCDAVGMSNDMYFADNGKNCCISSYIVHSNSEGIYKGIDIDDEVADNILFLDMWVKEGDKIEVFHNASMGIGAALLRFDNVEIMCAMMDKMDTYIRVLV